MKKYRIINRKRFVTAIAAIIAVTLILYACSFAYCRTNYEVCEFTVSEGDTLWGIAELYTDGSVDIRKYIWEIKKLNGMGTAELMPGDVIIIPVFNCGEAVTN